MADWHETNLSANGTTVQVDSKKPGVSAMSHCLYLKFLKFGMDRQTVRLSDRQTARLLDSQTARQTAIQREEAKICIFFLKNALKTFTTLSSRSNP